MSNSTKEWFFSWRAFLLLWAPIFLVTAAHYATPPALHWAHDVYRRLYYIPIVLGAFSFGLRGALSASLLASLVYIPHAFTHVAHMDPATSMEKLLEILLYNVVALITGLLAARERRERERQTRIAGELADALEAKKELEEQLIRSTRLQALGQLTAGLAHEIRNPLASIKGAAEVIADEVDGSSPRRKMVEIQRKELDRLQTLLDRFLRFARPAPVAREPLDLCSVAEHVLTLAAAQTRKMGIELQAPASCAGLEVLAAREELAQVVLNLVLNAVDASPEGATVRVSCDRADYGGRTFGRITVEDDGPGVPEELRQQVFNPFFTTKESGSGLGLSIAARIVDQHEGRLVLADRRTRGARFEVWIPAAE